MRKWGCDEAVPVPSGLAFIIGLLILAGYGLILLVQHAIGL